jgi:PTH1 family peptidyl-tRNA hydrolase|tara:strand:+ start:40 stop:600 length:561 start_codon:yes stop_codon:yes gene_type:complete
MLLLVGLGNPNPNNKNNRHNVGFSVIDAINQKFKLSKQKPKFKGLLTTGNIGEQKVYAIKPLTFMNSSGICIKELIEYFKINVKDVFVFHDDMDIDIGKVKVKFGGSSAGHNGIESIDKNIGKSYSRIRIGIGKPTNNSTGADHVLDNFSSEEIENVEEVTNNITESLLILIKKDLDLFSSKINQN